ncbi:MAG TPA: nuclear transport factor 2 family protein [Phytomonospora sp.]
MDKIDDTRAVLTAFLTDLGAEDFDAVAGHFAETVDWKVNWPEGEYPAAPWIRPRSTAAEAAGNFREIAAHHIRDKAGFELDRILVDGDDAVVLGVTRQTSRATGKGFAAMVAVHMTVTDGKISRYHVYEDSLAVAKAHGVS